jgi:hypothetical protein
MKKVLVIKTLNYTYGQQRTRFQSLIFTNLCYKDGSHRMVKGRSIFVDSISNRYYDSANPRIDLILIL